MMRLEIGTQIAVIRLAMVWTIMPTRIILQLGMKVRIHDDRFELDFAYVSVSIFFYLFQYLI